MGGKVVADIKRQGVYMFIKKRKFNNYLLARDYLSELGFSFQSRHSFKEDKSELWKHRNKNVWIHLKNDFDYQNFISIDKGEVWNINVFRRTYDTR